MAFCNSCGAQVDDGVKFCPGCGQAMAGAAAGGGAQPNPAGPTSSGGLNTDASENQNVMGALAYLLIPAIIFLVVEPYSKNRLIRFHSFQSLFFCLASVGIQIVLGILSSILAFVGIGFLIALVMPLVSLALFVVWIILVIKAFQGQQYKLPMIGDWAQQQV
jgi:uncharacterized membrane protein